MFPKDFLWGAAASSYQTEGGAHADGKGPSVWDVFAHQPGTIHMNQHGDEACDHYHRFREDVQLMKQLGLKAYRFSISWPRVLPDGTGRVNEAGMQFYSDLVDALLEAGIQPIVTLFHWDYPEALMRRGGWLNRECVEWFAEYTRVIVNRLSDRVSLWLTLNEPQCFAQLGYELGTHAPGMKVGRKQTFQVTHHLLLAHGRAVQVIREHAKLPPRIGFAPCLSFVMPDSNAPEDIAAAKAHVFSCRRDDGIWNTPWWLEPIFHGRYPQDGLVAYADWLPAVEAGDMELISQSLDFIGFNYYWTTRLTRPAEDGAAETANEWLLQPEGLYYMGRFLYEEYDLPLLITENGMANLDWPMLDGCVHDPQRIDYIHRHLLQVRRLLQESIPVQGYLYWTLLDNFEWQQGYSKRFGLIYVDFVTKQRIMKHSAHWYSRVIAENAINI